MTLVRVGSGLSATRLHVQREGTGDPLLWITGFAISSEIFDPVIGHYARSFDCVRYDNRGAGRSEAPWWPTSMPELASDAVRLLDALEIDSAHVYGLSMGGMIAQELAIRFPDRVRALVLGGTSHGGPFAALPSPKVAAALASRTAPSSLRAELVAGALFTDEYRREHPEEVVGHLQRLAAHRASLRGLLSHVLASLHHETRARLQLVQAPTLVMHGELDQFTPPANARMLAELIPDATLVVVPGTAHVYLLEKPEESYRLFAEWLAARSPVAPGHPLTGLAAAAEPVTRVLGLPIGAARAGASLAGLASPWRRPPPDWF